MTQAPPTDLTSRATLDGGQAVVALSGELDLSTAPELSRSLAPVIAARPRRVTLDLAGLAFIDCSGLSVIVRASKELSEHEGRLALAHPTRPVRRVLEIVGLDGLLVA